MAKKEYINAMKETQVILEIQLDVVYVLNRVYIIRRTALKTP